MILHIDPGTAFGTGMHETTELCIRQLKKYVTPTTRILDVGTGSGILSIIALMLGAEHAVGTDLDPCAVPAVEENKEANGIAPEKFELMIGNIIDDKEVQDAVGYEAYDLVVANILAGVLVPLTPVIVHQLKPGGLYITSGILDVKEAEVRQAVENAGMTVLEVTRQGEWVSTSRPESKKRKAGANMYRFFVKPEQIEENRIHITGGDVSHIAHVLRMKAGERDLHQRRGKDGIYLQDCADRQGRDSGRDPLRSGERTGAACRITLFQGLPKNDKMELIVQKAVELGACELSRWQPAGRW